MLGSRANLFKLRMGLSVFLMSTTVTKTLEERKAESRMLREKYPTIIPVILKLHERSHLPQALHDRLNLVPMNFSVGDMSYSIRKIVKLPKTTVMSLFIDKRYLLSPDLTVAEMDNRWRSEDGFVYILVSDQEQLGRYTLT